MKVAQEPSAIRMSDEGRSRAEVDICNDITAKIYMGEYVFGEKLPPIREFCKKYCYTGTTIKKALNLLKQKNLVKTQTSKGTIVTFDINNEEHKRGFVDFNSNMRELSSLKVPSLVIANMALEGIRSVGELGIVDIIAKINILLSEIDTSNDLGDLTHSFFVYLIGKSNNNIIMNVFKDFTKRNVLFVPQKGLSSEDIEKHRNLARNFYSNLRNLVEARMYILIKQSIIDFYTDLYNMPNIFLFKVDDSYSNSEISKDILYVEIVEDICIDILQGKIRKGDFLPTRQELCIKYKVSPKTVQRAFKELDFEGLISVEQFKGTILAADISDIEVKNKLERMLYNWTCQAMDSIRAVNCVLMDVVRELVNYITPITIADMRRELEQKVTDAINSGKFFSMAEILVMPILANMEYSYIHRYFYYILKPYLKFMLASSYSIKPRVEDIRYVYKLSSVAIRALKFGNCEMFISCMIIASIKTRDMYMNPNSNLKKIFIYNSRIQNG